MQAQDSVLVLGTDTCGPSGSVALGRLAGKGVEILGLVEMAGRTYSASLVAAVGDLLKEHGAALREIGCLVVVNGPGSFTGVRVGLSAAKGFAEGAEIPLIAVSRLEVLSAKAGVANAALDAHRHEVFLRLEGRELLAGSAELVAVSAPDRCAVCDDNATAMLAGAWPSTVLLQVLAPTAGDALHLAAPLIRARQYADAALVDGHYLRRSDAETFGDPAAGRA
jgi:tRNA threonylcarbamoyladenosine biosynthesis protein TsaB